MKLLTVTKKVSGAEYFIVYLFIVSVCLFILLAVVAVVVVVVVVIVSAEKGYDN